jgi:ubiquinone biosynthesis protein UbiJ
MLGGQLGESQRTVIQREVPKLLERIKRLEEAGDVLAQRADQLGLWPMAIEGWTKAKEAKP